MAFVGTPTQTGSVRDLLASVIAGEAGNQGTNGMTAVGAVIANRANSNFSGYGGSIQQQLLAPNQFQGQAAPTASSYSVADSILSGNYVDPTGGATSYANPGASQAAWARGLNSGNSLQIGDHFFTNNQSGNPFIPNFGPTTSGPSDHPGVDVGASGGTGDVTLNPNTPATPMDAGMASNTPGYMGSGNPITPSAGAGSGASAPTAPQSKATDTGGGAPINITDPTKIASDAGNTVSQALGGVTSGVAADTKSIESTGTGWLNSIFTGGTSLLVRGGLIMVGLFLLLGAFVFFYVDSKAPSQT